MGLSERPRRLLRSVVVVVIAVSGLMFAVGSPLGLAHSGEEAYVYLEIYDDVMEGRVEYPVSDLGDVLGLEIPQDEQGARAAVLANLDAVIEYTDAHLALGPPDRPWTLAFSKEFEILPVGAGTYVVVRFSVVDTFEELPRTFNVMFDGIVEAKPDKAALFLIASDWRSGTFANEAEHLLVFDADNPSQQVDLGKTSWPRAVAAVVGLGVDHIRIGTDHILFLIALVLPAVLVYKPPQGWKPAGGFGPSFWRVLKIVTMFTVAHTITLTLGGLGVVVLPEALVETVIAVSIALAALHNIRPSFSNREWLIAFVFGLFHGFGFAGLLADLGLDRSQRVLSLLGFNVGIEIGQAAILLLVFPALFILRRTRVYLPLMYAGSALLVLIALGWALDRSLGLDFRMLELVDILLTWPRPLYLVALLTAAATGLYFFERRRGHLLPTDEQEEEPAREPAESEPT